MSQKTKAPLTAEDIKTYLMQHPDFLSENPEVLALLKAPDRFKGGAGVVDLQRAMVGQLQREIQRLVADQQKLVHTTRQNLRLEKKIHAAVEGLLAAPSFESFIHHLTRELPLHLEIDLVSIGVESEHVSVTGVKTSGIQLLPAGFIDDFMGPKTRLRVENEIAGDPALYGAGAGLVRSQILLRLQISPRCPQAVMALGSRLTDDFTLNHGQEAPYLFLAACVSHLLRAWLDLPPY